PSGHVQAPALQLGGRFSAVVRGGDGQASVLVSLRVCDIASQQNPVHDRWQPRTINGKRRMTAKPFQHAPDAPWIFRTYAGHSTAEKSNALYRANLAKGQTGLSVAFDLPTQTG